MERTFQADEPILVGERDRRRRWIAGPGLDAEDVVAGRAIEEHAVATRPKLDIGERGRVARNELVAARLGHADVLGFGLVDAEEGLEGPLGDRLMQQSATPGIGLDRDREGPLRCEHQYALLSDRGPAVVLDRDPADLAEEPGHTHGTVVVGRRETRAHELDRADR